MAGGSRAARGIRRPLRAENGAPARLDSRSVRGLPPAHLNEGTPLLLSDAGGCAVRDRAWHGVVVAIGVHRATRDRDAHGRSGSRNRELRGVRLASLDTN